MAFVEKFNMYDVQRLLGWKTLANNGDSRYIVCPFCGAKKRSCNITANFFKCLKCGKQGNYYQVYAELFNITAENGKTSTQVARQEILKALSLDNEYVPAKSIEQAKEKKEMPKRDAKELDAVYRLLIKHLSLSEKHYKALRKRGLSDKQIKGYGFRSVDVKRTQEICRLILKEGLSLENVPGFYKNYGNWDILTKKEGYLCPVFDTENRLIGFQIRHDDPEEEKYKWLSSKNYASGTTSGSPSAYYGPKNGCETVYIVDGILKALVCKCLTNKKNVGFLGVAGVNNYKNCKASLEELAKKGLKNVVNAFDMDEFTDTTCKHDHKKCFECPNYNTHYHMTACNEKKIKVQGLKRGSEHLKATCASMNLNYSRYTWDLLSNGLWKEEIKGLDDYLLINK